MSTRFAKQLIYGTLYLIFWVALIGGAYAAMVRPATSCFDGKQNEGEQGIDCGGPCATVCKESTPPINVINVSAFDSTPTADTFLARIANPNSDIAAQSFDYEFDFYGGASSTILASSTGQSFLYADEAKYLLLPNVAIPTGFTSADVTITNTNWVQDNVLGIIPNLAVNGVATQVGSSSVVASGNLTDDDTAAFQNILIVAVFKDANGTPVGASQTELDNITPGQTETFSILYPYVANVNPAATEVVAYALR